MGYDWDTQINIFVVYVYGRKGELPSYAENEEAYTNLEKYNFDVDVVLTHTAPTHYAQHLINEKAEDPTCKILDDFAAKISFKRWYFGHFHEDRLLDDKFTAVYDKVLKLEG